MKKLQEILDVTFSVMILIAFFLPWADGASAYLLMKHYFSGLYNYFDIFMKDKPQELFFIIIVALPLLALLIIKNHLRSESDNQLRIYKIMLCVVFTISPVILNECGPFVKYWEFYEHPFNILQVGFYLTSVSAIYFLLSLIYLAQNK
jgi:hypothetical protein